MTEYIPKSVVLAEIERILDNSEEVHNNQYILLCNHFKHFLNTLKVKEVDLEKELDSMITPELKFHKALPSLFDVAKHFYKLGLSNQLTWQDIELIAKIGMDFMNSEDSDNLNHEEYYTEILNRFKAQKGKEI